MRPTVDLYAPGQSLGHKWTGIATDPALGAESISAKLRSSRIDKF